jgi:hypothetical protein
MVRLPHTRIFWSGLRIHRPSNELISYTFKRIVVNHERRVLEDFLRPHLVDNFLSHRLVFLVCSIGSHNHTTIWIQLQCHPVLFPFGVQRTVYRCFVCLTGNHRTWRVGLHPSPEHIPWPFRNRKLVCANTSHSSFWIGIILHLNLIESASIRVIHDFDSRGALPNAIDGQIWFHHSIVVYRLSAKRLCIPSFPLPIFPVIRMF